MYIDEYSPLQGLNGVTGAGKKPRRETSFLESGTSSGGDTVSFSREALDLAARLLARQTEALSRHSEAQGDARLSQLSGILVSDGAERTGTAIENGSDSSEDDSGAALRKKFRSYLRPEYGVKVGGPAEGTEKSTVSAAGSGASDGGEEDSGNDQIGKIEKQIKALQDELVEVLSSDLPEVAKETRAEEIQEKLSELMSQLAQLKRGETAGQNSGAPQKTRGASTAKI